MFLTFIISSVLFTGRPVDSTPVAEKVKFNEMILVEETSVPKATITYKR